MSEQVQVQASKTPSPGWSIWACMGCMEIVQVRGKYLVGMGEQRAEFWAVYSFGLTREGYPYAGYLHAQSKRAADLKSLFFSRLHGSPPFYPPPFGCKREVLSWVFFFSGIGIWVVFNGDAWSAWEWPFVSRALFFELCFSIPFLQMTIFSFMGIEGFLVRAVESFLLGVNLGNGLMGLSSRWQSLSISNSVCI